MKQKIQYIANVRSGVYLKEVPMGKACYLQVNDFDRMRNRFILPAPSLELDSKVKKHLLLDGDILLAAKGLSNFSSVYHENMGKSVASSSFLIYNSGMGEIPRL